MIKSLKYVLDILLKKVSGKIVRGVMAFIMALVLLFITWFADGLPYSFGGEDLIMKSIHIIDLIIPTQHKVIDDKYLLINVSFDKELATKDDEYDMHIGNIAITDREKLYRFLELIEGSSYSCLGIDIFFDPDISTEYDESLFNQISKMDRLVVACHSDKMPENRIENSKVAFSDYNINIYDNGFSKFTFLSSKQGESLALKLYNLSSDNIIDFKSPVNQKNIYLYFRNPINERFSAEGNNNWYYLGSEILNVYDKETIQNLVDDKIIIIGDFEGDDMHDTYIGQVSGPTIILNGIEALFHEDYKIKITSIITLFIVFFIICIFLTYGITIDTIGWKLVPILKILIDFISFTVVITVFEIILGLTNHEFHDMMWPSLILTLYSIFCRKLNIEYPLKK